MKAKNRVLFRCVALLLCVVMVAALLPEMTVSAALDTPVVSAKKSGNGIQVSWKPVTGAQKYRVFRKGPSDANWKKLADVASTTVSYKDTNVANGKTYKYTVRCLSKDGKTYQSSYDPAGASVSYWTYGTPSLSVSVVSNGIKISWNNVGAPQYRVFRDNGGWKKVGDTSGTSFVDVSVSPGVTYKYTVRAMSADKKAYVSYYDTAGKSITFAQEFKITALNPVDGGITVEWNTVPGITDYTVHRTTGQDWHQIHTGTITGNNYTDLGQDITDHIGLYNNETYSYRICYELADGTKKVTPVASQHYNETPELTEVECQQGKFVVKWKAVQGAAKYRVFRTLDTPPTSNWRQVADVTGNTYTDNDVTSGLSYYYTVRCLGTDGKYTSGYDKDGLKADYVGMPTLISTSVENDGVHFKFNKVGGIDEYQIYRKTASTSWVEYDTYSYSSDGGKNDVCDYTDSTANSGQIYYYTAACRSGGKVVSDKDENGLSVIPRSAPMPKASGAAEILQNGIRVNWYGIDGVTKYRVFRREFSGTVWKALGDVAGSSTGVTFTDNTAANNGHYVYTVRCLAANGNYASGFRELPDAIEVTFHRAPELVSAVTVSKLASGNGTIKVNWKPVEGVTNYSVYRRHIRKDGSMSNWVNLTHAATGTSYIDTPPASNFVYIYTVRCSNGSGPISWYNATGVRTHFMMAPQAGTSPYSRNASAIVVRWKAVDGATGYKVYRKVLNGNWSCIATINGYTTLTYKDTYKLVSGQDYYYTVRAFNSSSTSGYVDNLIYVP